MDIDLILHQERLRHQNLLKSESSHIDRDRALKRLEANRAYHNKSIELYNLYESLERMPTSMRVYTLRRMKELANDMKKFREVYPEGRVRYPLPKKEF